MVYRVENRILYRGFKTCTDGKDRIRKNDGKDAKGKWLTGQLVEILSPSVGEPQMPLLCLAPVNQKFKVMDAIVCPATLSMFTGIWISTDWNLLTKTQKEKWEKKHPGKEWKGIPIFEGDIFRCPWDKKLYVLLWDLLDGFYLTPMSNPGSRTAINSLSLEMYQYKGNLWQPPKEAEETWINEIHRLRGVELREEEQKLYF